MLRVHPTQGFVQKSTQQTVFLLLSGLESQLEESQLFFEDSLYQ